MKELCLVRSMINNMCWETTHRPVCKALHVTSPADEAEQD